MNKVKAALFDVDGVLNNAPELFSHIYADKHGLEVEDFNHFFRTKFRGALTGKIDLKDLIAQNRGLWQHGTPDEILAWWFEAENHPDKQLVDLIKEKKLQGLKTFMTSDQERRRAQYIYNVMFPGLFDGRFVSSEIGYRKEEPEYWHEVLTRLGRIGITTAEIVYFDDGQNNIDTAAQAGVHSVLYTNIESVREALR